MWSHVLGYSLGPLRQPPIQEAGAMWMHVFSLVVNISGRWSGYVQFDWAATYLGNQTNFTLGLVALVCSPFLLQRMRHKGLECLPQHRYVDSHGARLQAGTHS
jgi:hypothetical protein